MADDWPGQRLHQYAIFDRDDSLSDLLMGEEKRNINAPDACQRTPVFTAVSNNSIKCLKLLLENDANPSIPGGKRVNFMTPLHQAVMDDKKDMIKLLLQYGADTNIADDSGLSPLSLARNIGSPEILRIFEEEDKRRKRKASECVLELCQACRDCDVDKVKAILDKSLPASGWELPNTVAPEEESTPLSYAAKSGCVPIMEALLAKVARIERIAEVIHSAVEGGHLGVVRLILENAPECCNVCNTENLSPLHVASKLGHFDIVKCLLEWPYPDQLKPSLYADRGQICYKIAVNVNALTNDNKTALYLACENGHVDIVKYLLNYQVTGTRAIQNTISGARTQGSGAEDKVPIYPVRLCKEFGYDNNDSSKYDSESENNGMDLSTSCLYIAVKNGYHDIVQILLKTGSRTNIIQKLENIEYNALLLRALENEDLLMIDKLFTNKVEDTNSYVLKRAIQLKPVFILHFLKYKSSIDQHYSINKVAMRREYNTSFPYQDEEGSCVSTDSRYLEKFPTNPVYVRWQNLHFLTVIHENWLTCVSNHNNPNMKNVNIRVPLFAITRVDVSNNSLTILPTSLLQLPSLSVLNASKNKITEFPKQENFSLDCELLEDLDVSQNLLKALPSYLFTDLPALKSLNACRNKITEIPGSLWHTESLKTLDLSENLLEKLPKPEVFVRHTSESDLDINVSVGHDRKRSVLSGSVTSPDNIVYESMTSFDVRRINHWSPKLISDAEVKAAETKKGLKTLKLSQNHLTDFPDFLSCCAPILETLELSKNRLSSLGVLAAYPKLLKHLDLSNNKILDMVDWLRKRAPGQIDDTYCEHKLNPSRSGTCGHRSHLKLENLEELDLSSNKLSSLILLRDDDSGDRRTGSDARRPGSSISMSQSMRDLEESEQNIYRKLLFPNLSTLQVGFNQLDSLPEEIGELKSLKVLSLKKNMQLKELPAKLGLLDKLNRIEVELCPIEGPIQDIIRGDINPAKDVVGFLRSVLEESEEYNCMNLMVVGAYAKGKTSLLQHLAKWGTCPKERTHFVQREENQAKATTVDDKPLSTVGIDISYLVFEGKVGGRQRKVEFRTWDFAGQKEYYATHQYFLSPRSLYLAVWNITTGEAGIEELRQWLVNIQAQAPNSPVIIVGTHLDIIKEKRRCYPDTWEGSMIRLILEKYHIQDADKSGLPRVIGVMSVSCKGRRGENIDKLKNEIFAKVFELKHPGRRNEKLLGHKVPKKYILLQDCIKDIADERKQAGKEPVLDDDTYVVSVMNKMTPLAESKLTKSTGFRNKEDLYQATRFLHEIGVLCHFEDLALKGQYFIDPQWLSDQLAKVVSAQEIRNIAADGVMKITHLDGLYRNSTRISKFILSLLNKFEVALQFDKDHLILPSLLPTDKNLKPEMMKEIPVKRDDGAIPSRSGSMASVYSIGISTFFQELPSGKEGDLYIIDSKAEKNPLFASTRLYLMTYFPSGFWPRLITRILNDETFIKPAVEMYSFPSEVSEKCPDIAKGKPFWRCWQTGFELVMHGNVILQVKEVRTGTGYCQGMCNYDVENLAIKCHFENEWTDLEIKDSVILEISFQATKITFYFGAHHSCQNQSYQSVDSKEIYADERAQAEMLAKLVDHIDSLLQDWYPEIGEARFIQNCVGRYLVTRIVPCPLCLQEESKFQQESPGSWEVLHSHTDESERLSLGTSPPQAAGNEEGTSQSGERTLCTFLVENCIQNIFDGYDEVCMKHESVSPKVMNCNGTNRLLYVAPDLVFHDLDANFVVDDETLHLDKELGKGAFGKVFAGELRRDTSPICKVAVKVLYTEEDKEQKRGLATQMALEKVCQAYTTARQEVSILQTVHHPHIVPLLGFCRRPLSLLLALAPLGSLQDLLEKRHKEGLRLPVFVIKQIVIQVSDALDYLHNRSIIYRDLKSDNVLVWHFPKSSDNDPKQPVTVKLADYGISRSVMPAGAKGYGGTPPFIAPEILVHAGRDIYTEKVDIFSFGMFMFELLTCRAPLADINNPAVHVCNGGRPNITTEEANYPSHFLDLMSVCWEHDPLSRPTAAQIRMIASCSQFCHLADAISMETQAVVLSACSVASDSHRIDDSPIQEDQSQVWMATQVGGDTINPQYNVEVFTYDKRSKFVSSQELKQGGKIIGVCVVNQAVWCLDKTGIIHEYSTQTFQETNSLTLVRNNIEDLKAMFHYKGSNGSHVVILLQQEEFRRITSLFHLSDDVMGSKVIAEPVDIEEKCFCAAAVETLSGPRIWIGTNNGSVLVKSPENWDQDEGLLNPYDGPVVSSDLICMFIVSSCSKNLQNYAWTYNYQGSKVFCWDVNQRVVIRTLDCANIIPAVDSYKIHKLRKFEANQYQVTAVSVIDKYIYVSTTWGCVIVADAASLQPHSAFRCHGNEDFYCKAILPLGSATRSKELYNRQSLLSDEPAAEFCGVVTVGRGYVDLISHVTNLERQALVRTDSENGWSLVETGSVRSSPPMKTAFSSHTHVLSWLTEQWEYY